MLLWVNNHYGDFEGNPVMEDYLGTFEKGLEQQVSSKKLATLLVVPVTLLSINLGQFMFVHK